MSDSRKVSIFDYPNPVSIRKQPPGAWEALPRKIRQLVLKGTDQLRRIRLQVAVASPIKLMPPVQIVLTAWTSPGNEGCVLGRAKFLDLDAGRLSGIELPAPTVAFAQEHELRLLFVHEAAHCFDQMARAVNFLDGGGKPGDVLRLPSPSNPFDDHQHDDLMLGNFADWFGVADARRIARWNDHRLDPVTDATGIRWIAEGLPSEIPLQGMATSGLEIPDEVMARVRALRARRENEAVREVGSEASVPDGGKE